MYQSEQLSILIITVSLILFFAWLRPRLKALDPQETPRGLIFLVVLYVETINNFVESNMGKKRAPILSAYIGVVFLYLIISNYSGLLGLDPPTGNFSVTFTFAFITWVLIQYTKIKANGLKGYIKGFFEPFFPFVIPNLFGTIAPLISMSLRIFGNIVSGTVILNLVYTFTGWISSMLPFVGRFNFFALVIAPWLHLYFDLFSGFLQAFIFISLTSIFIAIEFNDEEENYG